MKVKAIQNIDGFFQALSKCKGKVELITEEKDVLNLASKLTQLIGLTRVFGRDDIESYEIVCYRIEDYELIKEFLIPYKEK